MHAAPRGPPIHLRRGAGSETLPISPRAPQCEYFGRAPTTSVPGLLYCFDQIRFFAKRRRIYRVPHKHSPNMTMTRQRIASEALPVSGTKPTSQRHCASLPVQCAFLASGKKGDAHQAT